MDEAAEQKLIGELQDQHRRVKAYRVDGTLIVVRKCSSGERSRMMDKMADPRSSKAAVHKELALSCIVHPDREAAKAILEEYPALYDDFANAAYELAKGGVEELGKA